MRAHTVAELEPEPRRRPDPACPTCRRSLDAGMRCLEAAMQTRAENALLRRHLRWIAEQAESEMMERDSGRTMSTLEFVRRTARAALGEVRSDG